MDVTLVELIDQEVGEPPSQRPDGFGITVNEYAEAKRCSETIARKQLEKAVKVGILEKKQMVEGQGTCPYVYYRRDHQ